MNEHIMTRYTADECATLQDRSDWVRVDALSDSDLEASIRQDPDADVEPADLLEGSTVQDLLTQAQRAVFVRLRLNHEVIAYFRGGGEDIERRMGEVLEAYVASQMQKRVSADREKSLED